jgi:erythromycin esterase
MFVSRIRMLLLVPALACAQAPVPNLDFEQGELGSVPPGWFVPSTLSQAGYKAVITQEGCRTGSCALITVPPTRPQNTFGNLMRTMDAQPYRGKRVVFRAAVRVQTSDPVGRAQMWLRVDRTGGLMGHFDNMMDRPIRSAEWALYEIRGTVDADARAFNIGVMALGDARVWVDDATLEFTDSPADTPELSAAREQLSKRYAEIDKAYNTGAFDSIKSFFTPDAKVGSPMMTLTVDEAISQLKSGLSASKIAMKTEITSMEVAGDQAAVRTRAVMTIGTGDSGSTREVTAADTWVRRDGVWLAKSSYSMSSRELLTPTDAETSAKIAAEIKKRATSLTTAEAGKPYDDLAAFGKAVGDARIVSLGEATHGTREIFQMKHRLLEYLVKEKGFTVFAIEANWPESQAADRYIKTGEGDPKKALADMYFWTWQTEEVLSMIEWMRAFNAAPGNHPILSFTAFDMQTYNVARDRVVEFVQKFAPDDSAAVKSAYALLYTLNANVRSDPGFEDAAKKAESVVALLESRRDALVRASSAAAFRDALQMARIAAQAARMRTPGAGGSFRDQMMAKNVEWLAREAHPKEKIVLWAHNGHIAKTPTVGFRPMGDWLRESMGSQVYVLGFAINTGTVRAVTSEGGKRIGLAESKIPASAAGTGDATFSAAGLPIFFLDVRSQPGDLGKWLAQPHLFRGCGAMWDRDSPDSFMHSEVLSARYDGIIFLENTHAARGLHGR